MDVKLIGILTVVAVLVHSGACLKCWVCDTQQTQGCNDPEFNVELKECSIHTIIGENAELAKSLEEEALKNHLNLTEFESLLVCQKGVTTIKGQKVIIRGCQVPVTDQGDPCGQFQSKIESLDKMEEVHFGHCSLCDTEACNGSDVVTAPVSGLFLSLVVALLSQMFH